MTKEEILEVLKASFQDLEADGHTIMYPKFFLDLGFTKEFVDSLTERQYSGGGKYDLYDNDGKRVDYIDGIHYLDFWSKLARILSPGFTSTKLGRGALARQFYHEVERVLKQEMDIEAVS
jgi:hypothetical protein